jgi:hypothetical protein
MTYDVPELRLAGTTRHIVLGDRLLKHDWTGFRYTSDEQNDLYSVDSQESVW